MLTKSPRRKYSPPAPPGGWKYPNGRTTSEAIAAGDHYAICFRKGDSPDGWWDGQSECSGAGGIDEALFCARLNFSNRIGRKVFIQRIIGGQIGCRLVEDCGEAIL